MVLPMAKGNRKNKGRGNGSAPDKDNGASQTNWPAWLGVAIALTGGIPGCIAFRDYWRRSSVEIAFDQEESVPCVIANAANPELNGRQAVLLYEVTIIGAGQSGFIASDVRASIKCADKWIDGEPFYPSQHESIDPNGVKVRGVHLHVGWKPGSSLPSSNDQLGEVGLGDMLVLADWKDFRPGDRLGFGEPERFMAATYFPLGTPNLPTCQKLQIRVKDYLDHEYVENFDVDALRRPPFVLYLDQSTPSVAKK